MKKLLLLILLSIVLSGKANETYLFTDTKTDLNGNLTDDFVTWIFSKGNDFLTLKTETQDVVYRITEVKRITAITGYFTKYVLDNGNAVYIHSETLEVIFNTETGQYVFSTADDNRYTNK